MPQKIPFFQLFPDLAPPPELKLPLLGSQICSAVIRQKDCSMELTLETRTPMAPEGFPSPARSAGGGGGGGATQSAWMLTLVKA